MERPPLRQTHTYATLDISAASYLEVRNRIVAVDEGLSTTERQCHDYRDQYIHEFGKPDEVIVLGPVGLVAETMKPGSYKICNMCHEPMKSDDDYGGDCVFCMADCGDPECLKTVIQIGRTARRAALL